MTPTLLQVQALSSRQLIRVPSPQASLNAVFLLQCTPGSAVLVSVATEGKGWAIKAALVGGRGSWQPSPHNSPDSRAWCGCMSSVLAGKAAALDVTEYTNRHKCQKRELIRPLLPTHAGGWCLTEPHSCGCETEFCQNQ